MSITKSDFLNYQACHSDFWFLKHLPQVRKAAPIDEFAQQIIDQGYEVERCAKQRFPGGKTVQAYGKDGAEWTRKFIAEGVKTIYQATFVQDGLEVRVDILERNALSGGWDIFEVKASSSKEKKKDEHLVDATFQKIVLEDSGMKVDNVYLIEVNSDYVRQGDIDVEELLKISEITTEVLEMEGPIRADIQGAKALLQSKTAPTSCGCRYLARGRHCASFDHLYPDTPSYGVYDLARIGNSKKKLPAMVDEGVLKMEEVRADHELSTIQMNQIETYLSDDIIFDHNAVSDELEKLVYPLYFLDYETYAPAVPAYDNTRPYQQVTFQYSLHVQKAPGAPYTHHEYLHNSKDIPMRKIAQRLREDIGDTGSVVVWHKSFEGNRNKELADANPDLRTFLLGLNERMYDLEDIFRKQYYVHKDFTGSSSIKYVTPVLCPDLSYKDLLIGNGGAATTMWPRMIFGELSAAERKEIYDGLLAYCKLDTWAMVRILSTVAKALED